ncbi:MAG: hypothetical protein MJ231_09070 [bacterium]|nr:hypothetical protein [bacterium]
MNNNFESELTIKEKRIIATYRVVSPEKKEKIDSMLKEMIENYKESLKNENNSENHEEK